MTFATAAALVDATTPAAPLAVKLHITEQLTSGARVLCPDCGFLADPASPCDVCMADAYDAMMANAESPMGCDPYARW